MSTARHRWCMECIANCHKLKVETVELFVRDEKNVEYLDGLLAKDGPTKLFCYYQPAENRNDLDESIPGEGPPRLLFTNGEDEALYGKACYFFRIGPVDSSKSGDANLLYGEINGAPLRSMENCMSKFYKPNFDSREEWGKTPEDQKTNFLEHDEKFVKDIQAALQDMNGGLDLKKPDKKFDLDGRAVGIRKAEDTEMLQHFEGLLETWCSEIEKHLAESDKEVSDKPDPGPLTEYDFWRRKLQRLTSITEQLKTKEFKSVVGHLTAYGKQAGTNTYNALLKRWKNLDIVITEAANEAKDNVKYLFTLEKFIEPLYTSTPTQIIDTLPALMNSIKMIHTIARYYNTTERMTQLFVKITNEMITNCKRCINGKDSPDKLWDKDPEELVINLESCSKLLEEYKEQYRLTKDKLLTMPKGKQFDFNESLIFSKFELFCRRVGKLIDMFSTIRQFKSLANHKLEGMEKLIDEFFEIIKNFRMKRHDLLGYQEGNFDREYVEFTVKISELENSLQLFINESFDSITSISHSLNLLKKFQSILQRDSLKSDLDSKFNIIFQNYGVELESVQALYEKHKHSPPIPRNLPPVAGNITWSRHLLKRIEEPMKKFESNQNVLNSKEAKRIIKTYNKVARTLVAFEYLWYQAWQSSIETAKAGLQATLIIRHPEDGKLYVNFDNEILQLIREAKCLDRMGIEIPESAKIVLLQEEKFKTYNNDLQYALNQYEEKIKKIIPVTQNLLRPHINDMEYKLRPGMITLTWTSMNIDAYKHHIESGLQKLDELIININDIVENRIEKNLKIISKTILMNLPSDQTLSLSDFVRQQEAHIAAQSILLQGKNVEVEDAVADLINVIKNFPLDPHIEEVSKKDIEQLKHHYNHFMYQALRSCTKNSLNALKKRVGVRNGISGGLFSTVKPFFLVDVQLAVPEVQLSPSLDMIQDSINKAAKAVLSCSSKLNDWGQRDLPGDAKPATFFDRITKDIEIVRVVLLLTGSVHGTKEQVKDYLKTFSDYDWLWKENKEKNYEKFMKINPQLDDYNKELKRFVDVENEIDVISPVHTIGALCLNTANLKIQLKQEASVWKVLYSKKLHDEARNQIETLTEYIKQTTNKVARGVEDGDLDSLRFMMETLKEIRERDSGIVNMEIRPVLDMYQLLEYYLPDGYMTKEEMDLRSVLKSKWSSLIIQADDVADDLSNKSVQFKRKLLKDIKSLKIEEEKFSADYYEKGPMVDGIEPKEAVERLKRYTQEFNIKKRKMELYGSGEELFALKKTEFTQLVKIQKELALLDTLYTLYMDVIHTVETEWREILWVDVISSIEDMTSKIENFSGRCKKMPKILREWKAFKDLSQTIVDFQNVLPLLQSLSKESIKTRHWGEVMKVTGSSFTVEGMTLSVLLDAKLTDKQDEIDEITDGADKQLNIENKLNEIKDQWQTRCFIFKNVEKRAGLKILTAYPVIIEELDEAQMQLRTMLTQRHVGPFQEEIQQKLKQLSDTSETLELWINVQQLWYSLESVFTGGDIAKNMPLEAKSFQKIDKDWTKNMQNAVEKEKVVECCANELLKSTLPVMFSGLEKCQKSLEGYLEQKKNCFPRFYFVSNPVLLMILSKGGDPLEMQPYYEKVFDSIAAVIHNNSDKLMIEKFLSREYGSEEVVPFDKAVKAVGNIENWLMDVLNEMKATMKTRTRRCAEDVSVLTQIEGLRRFVDSSCAQFAILGLQIIWTSDCQDALLNCKQKKNVVTDANKRSYDILNEVSSWCLQDLGTKMNRQKIETLVTIQVHQRDVINDIATLYKNKKLKDANDFEWLKQARFYWHPEQKDQLETDGLMQIAITNVDFTYQFEFLGVKERLCITPLTDRCYITLAQALGMYFGGAPAGPAGTGKTETVKDLGRTLGIFVVVTNCTDQMRYTDCGKIFKGLCQSGLWGCFDEFNRIKLPVLSVVAQQVLAINNAKKAKVKNFSFPGDPQQILLDPGCGFFITMNPGYAGRQELPENLKALFRGVTMMVPDREIIMRVTLCSVGYKQFTMLAKKFFVLYGLCEEQLSKTKHYDFGLRNIKSVLRTAGQTKRDNINADESVLLYRTLRDNNLSKLIAQDVPLFLSLLVDLFPGVPFPAKGTYPDVEKCIGEILDKENLIPHPSWVLKIIQFYETLKVRHGVMLSGPAGGGKTCVLNTLCSALTTLHKMPYKIVKMNPKAIRAPEMYGEVDPMSGEWTVGVFTAIWKKYNNREIKGFTWITLDGPVDAIWIEDLNTVLDDNRILTTSDGDRTPMTDNCKILFENETLANASPATVSRAGIIYVSDIDLDWKPITVAWIKTQKNEQHKKILETLINKHFGENVAEDPGHMFDWLIRNTSQVINSPRCGVIKQFQCLMSILLEKMGPSNNLDLDIEKMFLYCMTWCHGGLLEPADRIKFDEYLRKHASPGSMPECEHDTTIYEYFVDLSTFNWEKWRPPVWEYPQGDHLDFSNLLVPTMDSTRSLYLIDKLILARKYPTLLIGGPGTAKTSTALMFFKEHISPETHLTKRLNFSSATTCKSFQDSIEESLEKRGGKNFGPANNKKMVIFLDDLSMPAVNNWGDQPTLEIVRQLIEEGGFCFLDKDKRGDFKTCEDLTYISALGHPSGGRNNIPNRLKRQFFIFNLILPSVQSIDDIYGQMLHGKFTKENGFDASCLDIMSKLTRSTIELWNELKTKMLPTPAKFHYIFNLRDLSRVFQGILLTPNETYKTGGIKTPSNNQASTLLCIWFHECLRTFSDKLTNNPDKEKCLTFAKDVTKKHFGLEIGKAAFEPFFMVSCLRDDIMDPETGEVAQLAPQIYEPGGTLNDVRDRIQSFAERYNEIFPTKKLNLVLFDDALKHMLRISRIIQTPRGSALLVGVGGSGKQSLTRMAAYIARHYTFQIVLTKSYGIPSLLEDLKQLYIAAGHKRQKCTFIFTDAEIKNEYFLEYINAILNTGEIAGLLAKDEIMSICADIRPAFIRDRPGQLDSQDNLKAYFIDSVRDNLHICLCFSPMHPKFSERSIKFPGLFSCTSINWFLPWPQEALVAVSKGFISNFKLQCTDAEKNAVIDHMGSVHQMVVDICDEYYVKMRRQVYQTPKSYLSFLANYKSSYEKNLTQIQKIESSVNLGLQKLIQGAKDVEDMKVVLQKKQAEVADMNVKASAMLASLEISSSQAEKEGKEVTIIKDRCTTNAIEIAAKKSSCQSEVDAAMPFVYMANEAAASIQPAHINEIKKTLKPAHVVMLIFDGCLLLFQRPLETITSMTLNIAKKDVVFIKPSWDQSMALMNGNLLKDLMEFGKDGGPKDQINEETIELLLPYLELEGFNPQVAKSASNAAEGLCKWVQAMKEYHIASKIVKPKLEAVAIAEGDLKAANVKLAQAEAKLKECVDKLAALKTQFEEGMVKKKQNEDTAAQLQRKMTMASELINGLSGERVRWNEDAKNFEKRKRQLVGDCAVACAFVCYCGPFNQQYRQILIDEKFIRDCTQKNVPVTKGLDVISFSVDPGLIGDWNLQGLPTDTLSTQNGILVTKSSRFPLLIDPQGQGLSWIKNKEKDNTHPLGTIAINSNRLRDYLEFCMAEGKALIVTQVEEEIDPMLDPVLEKQINKKGKNFTISVADKPLEYVETFMMYFTSRLPNPRLSPELQAKVTLVDFTVTQKGLEEQLLGRVIGQEQRALEEQLSQVLAEVNNNKKTLAVLDTELLGRLTSNDGNLLDDEDLIGVLANTKAKAAEVSEKLIAADETKRNINEKRELFRPVATRGSVLYFSIVEMSNCNVMYQTSLVQFLTVFMKSMEVAEKASLPAKRVNNIIETMTYMVYRYINRGLYEADKILFVFIITCKILKTAGKLNGSDITLFMRGGAALDITSVRSKTVGWISDEAWLNVIQLSMSIEMFKTLPDEIVRNQDMWRRWYEDNEPEKQSVPEFESRFSDDKELGLFFRMLLVRSLRFDRSLLVIKTFIRNNEHMGVKYTDPISETIDMIYNDMTNDVPVIFLLSMGADPTDSIETLARKKKNSVNCISMGEGQETVARKALEIASYNGSWVLLQNCELGLDLMVQMEELLGKMKSNTAQPQHSDFRLFITALPDPSFPLGLLQMSTKITNEPPSGLRAGLMRSYAVMVDQDRLERIDSPIWRQMLYAISFLHSVVQERRKFGPLGWNIPYEYNNSDLSACLLFLEAHLYEVGTINWPTIQYMVSEVQYGGKITDNTDRVRFNTYASLWVSQATLSNDFVYNPSTPIAPIPYQYKVLSFEDFAEYNKTLSLFPEVDSPEILGFHPNADLTKLVNEVTRYMNNLGETQPKESGGGGGGPSREDIVYEKCTDLLDKLPADYIEEDYKLKIRKLGGLDVPLNIFLYQEIQRLQRVIGMVRSQCKAIKQAIKGEITMTNELLQSIYDIYDAKVPGKWLLTPGGDEFSWLLPTLGLWYSSLQKRHVQNYSWLTEGRPYSFWMTGFFNPNGLLTGMKQEVTRQHKAEKWALDDVVYHNELTEYEEAKQVRSTPKEGLHIHGLFLDGAAWSMSQQSLVESEPKKLFVSIPVLYVTAVTKTTKTKLRDNYTPYGPYECQVYKYAKRTDRYIIFTIWMNTKDKQPSHWILRGVGLLCSTD